MINPANPSNLYMAIGTPTGSAKNGVYVSNNGGRHLDARRQLPGGDRRRPDRAGGSPPRTTPAIVYAAITNPTTSALMSIQKSIDGGTTWAVPYTTAPPNYLGNLGNYDTYIAVDPGKPEHDLRGGQLRLGQRRPAPLNSIIESTNGGATWTDISADVDGNGPHIGHHGYTFDQNGQAARRQRRRDLAARPTPPPASLQLDRPERQPRHQRVQRDRPGPQQRRPRLRRHPGQRHRRSSTTTRPGPSSRGATAATSCVDPNHARRRSIATPSSRSAAATPQHHVLPAVVRRRRYLDQPDRCGIGTATRQRRRLSPVRPRPVESDPAPARDRPRLRIDEPGGILVPDQLPQDRQLQSSPGWNSNAPITALAIAPTDPNTIYAATGRRPDLRHRSTTARPGSSATSQVGTNVIGGHVRRSSSSIPSNANTVYAVRSSFNNGTSIGHVFKTTDGGMTWQDLSGNLPDLPTWSIAVDTRPGTARIYVGTDNGVYSSTDQGATWTPYKTGLPNVQVTEPGARPDHEHPRRRHARPGPVRDRGRADDRRHGEPAGDRGRGADAEQRPVAQFTDLVAPGPQSNYTATINWGDGHVTPIATLTPASGGGFIVSGSNTYAEEGTYTITVTVQDSDGDSGQNSATITVGDAPLTTPPTSTSTRPRARPSAAWSPPSRTAIPPHRAATSRRRSPGATASRPSGQVVADPAGNGLFDVIGSNFYTTLGTYPVTVVITRQRGSYAVHRRPGPRRSPTPPLTSTGQTIAAVEGTAFNGQVALFTDSNALGVLVDLHGDDQLGRRHADTARARSRPSSGQVRRLGQPHLHRGRHVSRHGHDRRRRAASTTTAHEHGQRHRRRR